MMIFESPHTSEPEQAFPSLSLDIFLILELPSKKRSSFFSKKQLQNTLKRLSQTLSLISSLLKVTAQHAIEKEEEKEHVLSLVLLKSYRSSPCYLIFLKRSLFSFLLSSSLTSSSQLNDDDDDDDEFIRRRKFDRVYS